MAEIMNNPDAEMHKQVAAVRAKQRGESVDDLPVGAGPVEVAEGEMSEAVGQSEDQKQARVAEAAISSETVGEEVKEAAEEVAASADEGEEIQIGDQVFKNQAEAIKYAQKLEQERLIEQAHSAGIREALEAQARASQQPVEQQPEEDLETEFYTNPKETLQKVQARARDEALAAVRAEQDKEKAWSEFLTEYPDIRRKDAERLLREEWAFFDKVDIKSGKKILAQKVRAEYAEIVEASRPRTQLSSAKAAVSPSGGTKSGVTQPKREEKPLSFSEQLRNMKKK